MANSDFPAPPLSKIADVDCASPSCHSLVLWFCRSIEVSPRAFIITLSLFSRLSSRCWLSTKTHESSSIREKMNEGVLLGGFHGGPQLGMLKSCFPPRRIYIYFRTSFPCFEPHPFGPNFIYRNSATLSDLTYFEI